MASSLATSEEHAAHGGSIKKWATSLPVEIYPLFFIMGCSLSYGVWSFIRPAREDPTLRLRRSGGFGGHNSAMNWRDQVSTN
ncbi:hypothetical protein AAFC00_002978 [Neodothiora populina]